jgi:hypothetical protein
VAEHAWSADRDWTRAATETDVLITADIATQMLERNTHNRPYRKWRTQQFITLLAENRFHNTGQGIAFYTDGALADGQHRLWAIRHSGLSARLDVRYGVPIAAAHAFDLPLRRQAGDYLAMKGESSGSNLASTLSLVEQYLDQTNGPRRGSRDYLTIDRLLATHGRHDPGDPPEWDLRNYITAARMVASRSTIPVTAAWAASYLTGEPPNPDDSDWFLGLIGKNARYANDPRTSLERQVTKARKPGRRVNSIWVVAMYGSAYRAYTRELDKEPAEREGVKNLAWRQGDPFPVFGRVQELRRLGLLAADLTDLGTTNTTGEA